MELIPDLPTLFPPENNLLFDSNETRAIEAYDLTVLQNKDAVWKRNKDAVWMSGLRDDGKAIPFSRWKVPAVQKRAISIYEVEQDLDWSQGSHSEADSDHTSSVSGEYSSDVGEDGEGEETEIEADVAGMVDDQYEASRPFDPESVQLPYFREVQIDMEEALARFSTSIIE